MQPKGTTLNDTVIPEVYIQHRTPELDGQQVAGRQSPDYRGRNHQRCKHGWCNCACHRVRSLANVAKGIAFRALAVGAACGLVVIWVNR
jgi:hypothetical protein